MKACIYGGHYGSEGKGSLAEWLAKTRESGTGRRLVVAGENSPNRGHTCSKGKTRNVPAASYWADVVLLGPDSVIEPETLLADMKAISGARAHTSPIYIIHQNAAILTDSHARQEQEAGLIDRVSSTGSGSGAARYEKGFKRQADSVIGHYRSEIPGMFTLFDVRIVGHWQYQTYVDQMKKDDWIFECSQGMLLDVNWGIYPFVTSRSTSPRVAIERNGLGQYDWEVYGVYRTYPIRTGGPSGPTGGVELSFKNIGVPDEIATVTKRLRRVFKFNADDYRLSIKLARPDYVAFTHLDYIGIEPDHHLTFRQWLECAELNPAVHLTPHYYLSNKIGSFIHHVL